MHGGGSGLFAQGLKAHTVIGQVAAAERYGRGGAQSNIFNSVPGAGRSVGRSAA